MQTHDADLLLQEATKLLQVADKEMARSEEDVISFLICHNARQAIINDMAAYLLKNNIEPTKPVTMQGLLEQCRNEDGRFQEVDLSNINCRHDADSQEYCLSIDKVGSCYNVAKVIHGIVAEQAPGY